MGIEKIKIAVFQPSNIRRTNAFYSGQHPIFKYLQKKYNYEITYFVDDENVKFDTVNVRYIKKNRIKTFFLRGFRKIFCRFKYYWKIPYYQDLTFSNYDIVVTEGIHHLFLDYFKNVANKVILNDSISYDYTLCNNQIRYLNKYFNESLAVVVNDKIPILYKKNNLKLNVTTIGYAVDVNLIPFVARKKCKGKLISIGRLVEEKGFEYIIRAIRRLKDKYPHLKLDIYGSGPLRNKLENLIRLLKLEGKVFLKGFLEYADLLKSLNDYDLFISHSITTKFWEEYFGMANLEAMANGLPVVTSNCGTVPYVVKDKAIIVEQKNVNQIIKAVENFMDNPQKVQEYSIKGRKYIEKNYSPEIVAKKWDEAIKNFIL